MQVLKRAAAALIAASFLFLGIGSFATAEAGAAAKAVAAHNYTAVWWKAPAGAEAGWGINFSHQGDIVFATWFTYDSDRKPQWFIALLDKSGERVYSGPVSRVTGPPFNSVPFSGRDVGRDGGRHRHGDVRRGRRERHVRLHGQRRVADQDDHPAAFRRRRCRRCTWGEQTDLVGVDQLPGAVVDARRRGIAAGGSISPIRANVIFATWFTYDAAGKPWWLIVLADRTGPRTYAGPVSTVSGPGFDAEPWDPNTVAETVVGQATITFTDGNHATLEYTVNGVHADQADRAPGVRRRGNGVRGTRPERGVRRELR